MFKKYLRRGGQRIVTVVDVRIIELVLLVLMTHGEIDHQLSGLVIIGRFWSPRTTNLGVNLVHTE